MMLPFSPLAGASFLLSFASTAAAKGVFAHIVAGNSGSYSADRWLSDVQEAQGAGIDGFIMNIAPNTYQLSSQLDNVYDAAAQVGSFSIFLSFDYLGGGTAWDASSVIDLINTYSGHSAQAKYNNLPLVTTFEGTGNAGDWTNINEQTGGIFFMPDYSSLGAPGAASQPAVDGLSSWVAWPDGPAEMTNGSDVWYVNNLGGKPYMMPVSPWFYANVNDENFLYRGDDLWYDRWQQVIELQPELVQIITWNDFGESHYVGPLPPSDANAIPGSPTETYTGSNSHEGWLLDLPYFISMYKTGSPPPSYTEHINVAYKLNPAGSGSDGGTLCHATSSSATYSPGSCSLDQLSINVLASSAGSVTIDIGGQGSQTYSVSSGMNHYAFPFDSLLGAPTVSLSRDGSVSVTVTGPAIADAGTVNWNAYVASASA